MITHDRGRGDPARRQDPADVQRPARAIAEIVENTMRAAAPATTFTTTPSTTAFATTWWISSSTARSGYKRRANRAAQRLRSGRGSPHRGRSGEAANVISLKH